MQLQQAQSACFIPNANNGRIKDVQNNLAGRHDHGAVQMTAVHPECFIADAQVNVQVDAVILQRNIAVEG